MLKVTFSKGDVNSDRTFYVNDLMDVKRVQDTLIDETQRVFAEDDEAKDEKLRQIFEMVDCETVFELYDWVSDMVELQNDLDRSGYDSIEDMVDRIGTLEEAIDSIYWSANDVRS